MNTYSREPASLPILEKIDGFKPKGPLHFESGGDPAELLARLPDDGLAIVGSRYPQRRSCELLESVMGGLRGSGLVIVSGFARGIDSRAHELAIDNGLRTIAVLGSGLDVDYPRENRRLRRRIVESGGMLVSHFAHGTQVYASNFLERNQLIAGFARATWVVEAAAVSGTLNTAMWASRMNRGLYATSSFPGDPFFQGNEKLLSQAEPDRYPVAEAMFGPRSLSTSWPFLGESGQTALELGRPLTRLQRWVLELQGEFGSCPVQTLMNHASARGLTLGSFYREFESEVEGGLLAHLPDGRVEVSRCRG